MTHCSYRDATRQVGERHVRRRRGRRSRARFASGKPLQTGAGMRKVVNDAENGN